MHQARAARLVAATDLRRRLRNRTFWLSAVVGPIVLATLISLAFGDEDFDATIGVVDDDGSELSGRFVEGVEGAEGGGLSFDVLGSAEARTAVDDGDVGAAIVVPPGFADSLATDDPGDLVVLTSSDGAVSAEVARAVAGDLADRADAARLATAGQAPAGMRRPPTCWRTSTCPCSSRPPGRAGTSRPPPTSGRRWVCCSCSCRWAPSPGPAGRASDRRARPHPRRPGVRCRRPGRQGGGRRRGRHRRPAGDLGGHVGGPGGRLGRPAGVVLLIVASALAVAGIAGLIAGVARTEQSADSLATAVAFVFALLGGAFIPPGDLPGSSASAVLTPTGWALRGFAELSAGGGRAWPTCPPVRRRAARLGRSSPASWPPACCPIGWGR